MLSSCTTVTALMTEVTAPPKAQGCHSAAVPPHRAGGENLHRHLGSGQWSSQLVGGLEGQRQEAWGRGTRMDVWEQAAHVKMLAPRQCPARQHPLWRRHRTAECTK